MVAYRAYLRSILAYKDMSAIDALPDAVAILREYGLVLNVLK